MFNSKSLVLIFYLMQISSSVILYPTFEQLYQQLLTNGTLPNCTVETCQKTINQANFTFVNLTHRSLLKLADYEKRIPNQSGPYIITSTGIYRGKRIQYRHNRTIDQFLGIYYAELPQSLEKPRKKIFNYSIVQARKCTPYCMQSLLMTENLSYGSFIMQSHFHDNCLSLNIYRADLRSGDKQKAIMIFSHGGSNQIGGGSLFDGSILASEGDIIVITMNFRLNYHGFLSSGDDRVKGNYGLWDQLLAIEWVYENAHLFGGDRNRIVLAGHSAGAGNVMLIPASQYCRGMIKRVISQSGTGLAPWSINHQPMKLIERLSKEFHCQRLDENEMFQCIYKLLENNDGDFYRLHLSLSIADDNPYPVIDHDFLNDTIENLLQSDIYQHIDFLTGVTLNEGLYFAEYHIGHFYNDFNNQSSSIGKRLSTREKRSLDSNAIAFIPPDLIIPKTTTDDDDDDEDDEQTQSNTRTHLEQTLNYDPNIVLEQFSKLDYIEKYVNANFRYGQCYLKDIRKRYEYPSKNNLTGRIQLYIDLVSDLMFNFHMVHCLNLRTQVPTQRAKNYAYIYAHKPTFKARSLFRDHLKTLPNVIGHFAELDYVFGVPLARDFPRIHKNVNISYYDYSIDEINFSRELIRYWSNFIKTGNPNKDSPTIHEWKEYTQSEHNYIIFQLNNIHTERNYFDSMYKFWLKTYETESNGGCQDLFFQIRMKKHYGIFFALILVLILIFLCIYLRKVFRNRQRYQTTNNYPRFINT